MSVLSVVATCYNEEKTLSMHINKVLAIYCKTPSAIRLVLYCIVREIVVIVGNIFFIELLESIGTFVAVAIAFLQLAAFKYYSCIFLPFYRKVRCCNPLELLSGATVVALWDSFCCDEEILSAERICVSSIEIVRESN